MEKKAIDILCVGLTVCDIIAKPVSRAVFDVDSTKIDMIKVASGGDALNAAVNMAKLGVKVALAGGVGQDMMGEFLRGEAARAGVDTGGLKASADVSTSTSIVLVDESGERRFIYCGKANNEFSPEDVGDAALKSARIVHLGSAMALAGFEGGALAEFFRKAKDAGAITSMDVTWDSTGRWLGKIEEALYYTDLFMPSFNEAKHITGLRDPEAMADFFSKYGLQALVVKLGSDGCLVTDYRERRVIPAFDVGVPADTTGAGDAFVSGFLAGTIKGMDLYERGLLGNAAAACCVTEVGATAGTRNWDETITFMRTARRKKE